MAQKTCDVAEALEKHDGNHIGFRTWQIGL
jgi:hypothetical protein